MHRQALGLMEVVLGRQHPNTVTSVYCLAYLLHLQQRLSEAGPLYQRALVTHVRPRSLAESALWTLSVPIKERHSIPLHRAVPVVLWSLLGQASTSGRYLRRSMMDGHETPFVPLWRCGCGWYGCVTDMPSLKK